MKKAEQKSMCPYAGHKPEGKRYIKWIVKRARRRAEKRDPENAPKRLRGYTWGWS